MNTYKNDKNINKERDNIDVNVQKLQVFGQRSKTPPSCTLTADRILLMLISSISPTTLAN